MSPIAFGYIGIGAADLDDWQSFSTDMLGMQVSERTGTSLSLRMDDRRQRIVIGRDKSIGPHFYGWEVENESALDSIAPAVESAGVKVTREPRSLADQRFVRNLISFSDPVGNRLEFFHGSEVTDEAFRPGRAISGFRTGALGLGHLVLTVQRIEAVLPFYRDVLGFRISDFVLTPFKAYFLHINTRHHSLALIEGPANGIHHLMVELYSLDDVGQGYDIAQGIPDAVRVTLGRHPNDLMTSFYVNTPSNFMMEYGWGGREIDPNIWQAVEMTDGPSLWGHDRLWLPPEARARARDLRLDTGRRGVRQPVQVLDGNFNRMRGACPWWDSYKKAAE